MLGEAGLGAVGKECFVLHRLLLLKRGLLGLGRAFSYRVKTEVVQEILFLLGCQDLRCRLGAFGLLPFEPLRVNCERELNILDADKAPRVEDPRLIVLEYGEHQIDLLQPEEDELFDVVLDCFRVEGRVVGPGQFVALFFNKPLDPEAVETGVVDKLSHEPLVL
jgi:hypothetical protein